MIKHLLPIAALLLSSTASWSAVSAFEARKIADREVNDIARKNFVQIYGTRSPLTQLPVEWQVLYYDPYADQNGTLVTVTGNTITRIQQGYVQMNRLRLFAYKQDEVIQSEQLKHDSKDLPGILKRSSTLKDVNLSSIEMWLRKDGKGPIAPPIWDLVLFSPDPKNADSEIRLGTARINAESGQIIELKVDLNRLNR